MTSQFRRASLQPLISADPIQPLVPGGKWSLRLSSLSPLQQRLLRISRLALYSHTTTTSPDGEILLMLCWSVFCKLNSPSLAMTPVLTCPKKLIMQKLVAQSAWLQLSLVGDSWCGDWKMGAQWLNISDVACGNSECYHGMVLHHWFPILYSRFG